MGEGGRGDEGMTEVCMYVGGRWRHDVERGLLLECSHDGRHDSGILLLKDASLLGGGEASIRCHPGTLLPQPEVRGRGGIEE